MIALWIMVAFHLSPLDLPSPLPGHAGSALRGTVIQLALIPDHDQTALDASVCRAPWVNSKISAQKFPQAVVKSRRCQVGLSFEKTQMSSHGGHFLF
jgi:hypothetical protein